MLLNEFNVPVITFVTAAISTMVSIVFVHQWRAYRGSMAGLGWWSWAPLAAFFGAVLLGLRGYLPPLGSVVLGNMFVIASPIFFYIGSAWFFGVAQPKWPWYLLGVVTLCLYFWGVVSPNFQARVVVLALALLMVEAGLLALLFRHRRTTFAGLFLIASTTLAMSLFALRILTIGVEDPGADPAVRTLVHNLYLGGFGFWGIAQTIGFVLLAQERLRERIEQIASQDALTGVLARGSLFSLGCAAMLMHQRTQKPLSIVLFDLDYFKRTNDTYGHLVGDAVLRDFARRIETALRPGDLIGRYGGEEFLAILPDTTMQEARTIADQIRANDVGNGLPYVTVSAGVATAQLPQPGLEPGLAFERLVEEADYALYQAKKDGRDRVVCADHSSGLTGAGTWPAAPIMSAGLQP